MIAQVSGRVSTEGMLERLRAGDVRALARAISMVEDRLPGAEALLEAARAIAGRVLRVGVTGAPGAGKSTLVDRMARQLAEEGEKVGVVAVDPTSPQTGGALLGDRIRMQGENGVYIRSMASRGALGGVSRAVSDVCDVMAAAGRETVLIETVGVGQDEVEVSRLADVTVLVLVPGMGDDVQSLKAGVMEVADVYIINKSDRGGAEQVEAEIVAMQGLATASGGWVAPVVRCVATTGEGVARLMEEVRRCAEWKAGSGASSNKYRSFDFGGVAAFAQDDTFIDGGKNGLRLDHLGVAVKSIAAARGFYEGLGMRVAHEETVEHEQVKTAMLPVGESRIELLEATAEDSVIGRFVAKRGEGLHHIAVAVEDVDEMFRRLKEQGIRLASDAVRVGAGGHRYFFVHPASTGGVLVEIVGDMEKGRS
ncbi:MAG: methylmalonyl Co-A mutase-associated GTPase MeaB [Acidobacteria bacterium]|nr:methylmalonyl Co-A mutase-associated GTPase MeaB [Acidobacteriota bacterium]